MSVNNLVGQEMEVIIEDVGYCCLQSFRLQLTNDLVPVNTSDLGVWKGNLPTLNGWVLSASYLYCLSDENFPALFALYKDRRRVWVKLQRDPADGFYWEGNAQIANLDLSGGIDRAVAFNVVFQGHGGLNMEEYYNLWVDENNDFMMDENLDFLMI